MKNAVSGKGAARFGISQSIGAEGGKFKTKRQLQEIREAEKQCSPVELFKRFYEDIHGKCMSEKELGIIREIVEKAEEGMQ